MSENILKLIPSSPTYTPHENDLAKVSALLKESLPSSVSYSINISQVVRFIDPGSNLATIFCPNCDSIIDLTWWQESMDKAYEHKFEKLSVQVPCCKITLGLNDLKYKWPAGFAKFSIDIRNPNQDITDLTLSKLEDLIGISMIKIWGHY